MEARPAVLGRVVAGAWRLGRFPGPVGLEAEADSQPRIDDLDALERERAGREVETVGDDPIDGNDVRGEHGVQEPARFRHRVDRFALVGPPSDLAEERAVLVVRVEAIGDVGIGVGQVEVVDVRREDPDPRVAAPLVPPRQEDERVLGSAEELNGIVVVEVDRAVRAGECRSSDRQPFELSRAGRPETTTIEDLGRTGPEDRRRAGRDRAGRSIVRCGRDRARPGCNRCEDDSACCDDRRPMPGTNGCEMADGCWSMMSWPELLESS